MNARPSNSCLVTCWRAALWLLAAWLPAAAAQAAQTSRNLDDFDFVTATVATSYAGWHSKTAGARRDEIDRLTAALRAQVAAGDDAAWRAALERWVGWFGDGHLQIHWHDDAPAAAAAAAPAPRFSLERLDADTLYLRLPSFNDGYTDTVRSLIDTHAEALARTPQLIIDVRGNGGGSDFVYAPLLTYLYTQPIVRVGVEVRVSSVNQRLRREVAGLIEAASPEGARVLREESARMDTASAPYIRREPPVSIVRFDRARANPARIGVLIDGAASSAESFLLDARQSRKVTLFGQRNSAGVLDFGEMMQMAAPSGRFTLGWATTRSLRLPADPVDPDGIAPDVRIPADAHDPVAFAVRWLRQYGPRAIR